MLTLPAYNFKTLFAQLPGLYLILHPDLTIADASNAYLKASLTVKENIIGRNIFEIFPDNPDDADANGVANLQASLHYVLQQQQPHAMAEQKYDIRHPDGSFETRYWSPLNTPIFNEQQELICILHQVVDVTERKKSEKKFLALLEAAPDATIFVNAQGNIHMLNQKAEQLFGYSQGEMIGQSVEIVVPASIRHQHVHQRDSFIKAEGVRPMHTRDSLSAVKKDGTVFDADISLSPIHTDEGLFIIATIRDISQRKKIQQQLELLSQQVNQANDAIYAVDINRVITSWNKGAEQLFGFTAAEALGKQTLALLKTETGEEIIKAALKTVAEKDYWAGELKRKNKKGEEVVVHTSISAIRDRNKKLIGYITVAVDITDQHKLQDQLNYMAKIVEQSSEAIISIGLDRRIISWNKGAEKMLGYPKAAIIGKTADDLGILVLTPTEITELENEIINYGSWKSEKEYKHQSGTTFFGAVSGYAVNNEAGEMTAVVFIIKDISLRKQLEENLKRSNEELEEKVKLRTAEIIKSETKYRHLFQNNPIPMWVMELSDFKILDVNEMAVEHYGYSRQEFLSMTALDIRPDTEKEIFLATEHPLKITDHNHNRGIWRHKKKDGSIIQVEIIVHDIVFEGIPARIVLANDVTEKKKTEEKLVASEKRFRALLENSNDIITLMDSSFKLIYRSPASTKITGWTNEDMMGVDATRNVHPDDKAMANDVVREVMANPSKTVYIKFRLRHKQGHYLWMEGTLCNLLQDKYVKAVVFNFRDITARTEAEDKLNLHFKEKQELAARMSTILNTLPANIALLDENGIIVEVNDSWKEFAKENGYTGDNYGIGCNYIECAKHRKGKFNADGNKVAEGIAAVLNNTLTEFVHEYPCHSPNKERWFRMITTPLQNKEYAGAVVMHLDISELRRLEKARLKSSIEEQKKITLAVLQGQEKERNYIGRELHDNVNQILAGAKLFLSSAGNKNEKVKELIQYPIELLNSSIEEIRSLCRNLVSPLKNIDLEEMAKALLAHCSQNVKTTFHYTVPKQLLSDDMKLNIYRILQELINNTLKYAAATNLIVSVKAAHKILNVVVADDGKGFDVDTKREGIGISNIINRVESFNGKLEIKSSPGYGCITSITIPC